MHSEPLTLSHQGQLREKLFGLNLQLSEYSFANLYLFRNIHHYLLLTEEKERFIKGVTRDGVSFIMLTSPPSSLSSAMLSQLLSYAEVLFPIPDSWLPMLEKFLVQASFKEDDSDYLFATSKLATYPGRHLSNKRNLVKQLLRAHEIRSEIISQHNLAEAQHVLEQWQQEQEVPPSATDYNACQEAIQLFQGLHLHGRLIYVDSIPSGLVIGDWTTTDCYAIHFCKALSSIKGLYQYLYQDLAETLEGRCEWINLEQDLGLPNIRQAKHSYLPNKLLRKWRVQLNVYALL